MLRPHTFFMALLLCSTASAQHGVIREYAALAPKPHATPLRPLLDFPLTDVSITAGHDGAYYLTGSAVSAGAAAFSPSVTIWRSADMAKWSKLRTIGAGKPVRSPEIHYLGNRYWLTLGLQGGGTELLAFNTTDIAAGSFRRASITSSGEDPSLFLDDDGAWYWVMGAGEIARMKADPTQGLAEPPKLVIEPVTGDVRSHAMRGAYLAKIRGYYHLFVGERRLRFGNTGRTGLEGGTDDTFVAVSSRPDAGYGKTRYLAFPDTGQTTLFHGPGGQLWATWSCTDSRGVFSLKPGAFPVEIVDATKPVWPIGFDFDRPDPPVKYSPQGFMLRPGTSHIYERGVGMYQPVPMDPVPGQRAPFPWIRDTSITRGGDGMYYMTGTSGNLDAIHLWRSPDLKRFSYWKPAFQFDNSDPDLWYNKRAGKLLWAPEIHYLKDNYWIAWCVNQKMGMGLLKSSTGKPDGPYVPAYPGNHAFLSPNIDASLFVDDNGAPYFLYQGRYLRKLNPDLSGFAGEPVELLTVDGEQVGYEGIFMRKIGKWYVLIAAEWNGGGNRADGTYDMMYSVSTNLLGPYSRRRVGVPHGGHSTMFQDAAGGWYLAFFGNDRTAPFRAMPGVVPLDIQDTGSDLMIGVRPPEFRERTIATGLKGGYQVLAVDMNHDGKKDLVALGSGLSELVWFENPGWTRHVIASGFNQMINVAAVEGKDGIPDLVLAHEFSSDARKSLGLVSLLKHNGDPRNAWSVTEIDRLPTSHRLRLADIDGSGKPVVVNAPLTNAQAKPPEYRGHTPLVYYRPGEWKRRLIGDENEGVMHGIAAVDWNGDGRDEILTASFSGISLYSLDLSGKWVRLEVARGDPSPWPKSGASDIAVGHLGKNRFVCSIEPWHGNQVVVYFQNKGVWERHVIDAGFDEAHTIITADLDGDGQDEIIAGDRGKARSVHIYRSERGKWVRRTLDNGGMAASSCIATDLNGDGRLEIACIGGATQNLKLYEYAGQPVK